MRRLPIASRVTQLLAASGVVVWSHASSAQVPADETRIAVIEDAQADKAGTLQPYVEPKALQYFDWAERTVLTRRGLHPFFFNAYSGGGFTVGAGYLTYLGTEDTLDVRGSITLSAYKRIEAEYSSARLFKRQGALSIVGGWREATQVGFYGYGSSTSKDARANYGFTEPYVRSLLRFRPSRSLLRLEGGADFSEWNQGPGSGSAPSIEEIYTPETLSGLGASVTYLHSHATVALDSRNAPGYARRGGSYGVTFHDFSDMDSRYGFTQVEYEALQHIPIRRDAWVLSFRGAVAMAHEKGEEEIPFFMLPSVGGGSSLRGFSSWRFRDRNSLELQAEWRVIVNRFLDVAVFYDAGKVAADTSDINFSDLRNDYGFGVRFHGPLSTPLRIDLASGGEGLKIVWSAAAVF